MSEPISTKVNSQVSAEGSFLKATKDYYNNNIQMFDTYPFAKERGARTALAITKAVELDKDSTTVLEFGCGNGIVCKELYPHVKSILGVDISDAAVKWFNETFEEAGLSDRVKAITTNLEADQSVLGTQKFELIFSASVYHHLDSPSSVTNLLATFLKPKGTLITVANYLENGADAKARIPDSHKHVLSHYGFTEQDMKAMYEDAGLKFESYARVPEHEGDNELFIAKGVKE
ncbi:S-adenosyl-L-methionine-dependent methyltransferase [Coprinopsis marcescibilis]|uniref:S-adenosyl-L-methionine-dependent methyltransferase n=1 Tax=Coprinopsis marcescibilis TaxID=230819 RepID=A0A5C3KGC3_COPMA|nr:S-adenosyl-L-methionine-dependent methyltransferase [Coprinopsis marcescibilis]